MLDTKVIANTDTTNFTKFPINISLLIVPNLNHNLFLDILKMLAHPNNYTILCNHLGLCG